MPTILQSLALSLAPLTAVPAGAALLIWREPGRRVRSGLQHFAAGALVAVIAVELLGRVAEGSPAAAALGILVGTAAMVGLDALGERIGRRSPGSAVGFLSVVAVDFLLDGLLLGAALRHEAELAFLLTIALTLEDVINGMSAAAALLETTPPRRVVLLVAVVAAGLPVGAVAGAALGSVLTGATFLAVLAFASVAMLFLVFEELMREAHATRETPAATVTVPRASGFPPAGAPDVTAEPHLTRLRGPDSPAGRSCSAIRRCAPPDR
ncbi:ZIP family metal transporter [Amycolatopsis thermoflava]|uniref:ZIP family metal transporter n=1 Tax=Amycolatopsis thermoflava TaxID=84480 RepID=UPI003EBAA847